MDRRRSMIRNHFLLMFFTVSRGKFSTEDVRTPQFLIFSFPHRVIWFQINLFDACTQLIGKRSDPIRICKNRTVGKNNA